MKRQLKVFVIDLMLIVDASENEPFSDTVNDNNMISI